MNKILIGVSLGETVKSEWWAHWAKGCPSQAVNMLNYIPVLFKIGSSRANNRNAIVMQAFNEYPDWDRLLFIDPDILFPTDLIDRVNQHTHPIVGGVYFGPNSKQDLVAWRVGPNGTGHLAYPPDEVDRMVENPALYRVAALGMGCTSIARAVFEILAENGDPWFANNPGIDNPYAEDIGFCYRALVRGIDIYLDTSIVCDRVSIKS